MHSVSQGPVRLLGAGAEMALGDAAAGSREDPAYLRQQLLTYLGNKRALLGPIEQAVRSVRRRLGGRRLRVLDPFAGSGVVSRLLKGHARRLVSGDLEAYAAVVARCYLRNRSTVDLGALAQIARDWNRRVELDEGAAPGLIAERYAPRDEGDIQPEDRVFYTRDNARRIDRFRQWIDQADPALRDLLLGPLLAEASVHANTAGVFKGFYKDRRTGLGRFGGTGRDALPRILGAIRMQPPVLSRFECDVEVFQEDANQRVRREEGLDLAYLDPPYNQHPYGSNYFMLNLIVRYEPPVRPSRVSGIPVDWTRSGYNRRVQSLDLLQDLLEHLDTSHVLLSYNNEGFISLPDLETLLARYGAFERVEIPYTTFRGSRSFAHRPLRVTEHLFLLERR